MSRVGGLLYGFTIERVHCVPLTETSSEIIGLLPVDPVKTRLNEGMLNHTKMASRELTLLSRAQRALAEARTVNEFKDVRDLAEAARGYARRKKFARDVLLEVACLTIQAEHALGMALSQIELAKAAPGNQYATVDRSQTGTGPTYLRDLGITKQASHRAQFIASLPKEKLEHWLREQCAKGIEPTLSGARRYAGESAQRKSKRRIRKAESLTPVDALTELLEHQKMLSQLLSKVYDGGTIARGDGRLACRLIGEIGELAGELAKILQKQWIGSEHRRT